MPRFLPKRWALPLSAAVLATASAGAWAQQYPAPYTSQQSDPFQNQPADGGYVGNAYEGNAYAGSAQPPVPAGEQAYGRVISVAPSYRQVNVPQPVCQDQQVYTGQRTSGVGAVAGAVIGGVLGNGIGGGFGRATATGVGVLAGSAIGNQVEGGYPSYQTVRQCATQYVTQNQPDGYSVEYEYAGRRYNTRTNTQPGEWLPLSIQPVATYDNYNPQPYAAVGPSNAVPEPGMVVGSGVMPPAPVAVAPTPVYMAPPAYYAAPIAVQPVIQLGIGGYWGGGRRHWR